MLWRLTYSAAQGPLASASRWAQQPCFFSMRHSPSMLSRASLPAKSAAGSAAHRPWTTRPAAALASALVSPPKKPAGRHTHTHRQLAAGDGLMHGCGVWSQVASWGRGERGSQRRTDGAPDELPERLCDVLCKIYSQMADILGRHTCRTVAAGFSRTTLPCQAERSPSPPAGLCTGRPSLPSAAIHGRSRWISSFCCCRKTSALARWSSMFQNSTEEGPALSLRAQTSGNGVKGMC